MDDGQQRSFPRPWFFSSVDNEHVYQLPWLHNQPTQAGSVKPQQSSTVSLLVLTQFSLEGFHAAAVGWERELGPSGLI